MRARGNQGESIATDYLLKNGYEILERNFSCRTGEVDIIALDQEVLAFIEVKYYKVNSLRNIYDAVDREKQHKIIKAAERYFYQHQEYRRHVTRFDVVLITADTQDAVNHIELHKDAFRYN